MNKHTTARRGKRIRLRLKSGEIVIDKLVERKSSFYVFEALGKVQASEIVSFSIAKQK